MKIKIIKRYADKIAKMNGFNDFTDIMNYINDTNLKKYDNLNLSRRDFIKFIMFCHLKDSDLIKLETEIR